VLDGQWIGGIAGLADAVLATTAIALLDKLPLLVGKTGYRHIRLDVFHNFRIGVDAQACHEVRKRLIAVGRQFDQCLNPLDVEGFELSAEVDQFLMFGGRQGFGLAFGDEAMVLIPSGGWESDVNGLQQLGFVSVRCGVESFLEGVEDEAIGFHALYSGFGLKSVGEFWSEVQGESGHGDCDGAQQYVSV
jgi:hypothetical protein